MATRVKEIIQKRGSLKAQITNFRKFIDENEDSEVSIENITRRIEKINKSFEPFDEISDELELLDAANAEHYSTTRAEIEENYFSVLDAADKIKRKAISRDQSVAQHVNSSRDTLSENNSNEDSINRSQRRKIRLPEAKVPPFSGKYEDWLAFKDGFTSLIDEQNDISNVEKLQYLKGFVTGPAYDTIKNLASTDDNYERAWSLLKDTYADTRQIIARHLTIILSLPVQTHESAEGLRKLTNDTRQNLESLASLGVKIPDPILVQNIELKLHRDTADKWEETLEFGVFPTLEKLFNFLNKTATRLSKRETSTVKNATEPQQGKSNLFQRKKKKGGSNQTFLTASGYQCPVCKEAHALYRCKTFKDAPIRKRVEIVKSSSLCLLCLREHSNKPCKFSKCMVCDRKENFMLHEHSASSSKD